MTFVKKGIVIDLGAGGTIDDSLVYQGCVIFHNNMFYAYYSGYDHSNERIALAISDDGINFVKKGIVVDKGGAGEVDVNAAYNPSVIIHNNKFYCYYHSNDGVTNLRACLAISDDGVNFVKKGVVIDIGGIGEFDDQFVEEPRVIIHNDKFYCYYTGRDGAIERTGLAISDDGVNFVKKGIIIPLGGAGEIDDTKAYQCSVIIINNKFNCYYSASDNSYVRVALAISDDGVNFVKKGIVVDNGGAGEVDDHSIWQQHAILHNDKLYCYSGPYDGLRERASLSISEDGF